jgi:hypothetical protein
MHRSPAPLLALLLACGDSDGGDTGSGGASTGEPTTAASTTGEPTTAPTTDATDAATSTTGDPPGTTGDDPATGTTGDPAFCNGWETPAGAPYLVLHDREGAELVDGAVLPLECGPQGLFMFGLYPTFGGFTPPGDIIDFALVVDVDGFNDNPEGHFYSADPVGYWVSCDPIVGAPTGVLPVFPLDNLDDLTALDQRPASLRVVLRTGDGEVEVDVDVVLAVAKDDSWGFCGG